MATVFSQKTNIFFAKFYLTPIGIGERSNGSYGKLNWFPLSEVQYSLVGLDLGFNLFQKENEDETRKALQHTIILDYGLGIVYDLRFNRSNKKIDYALELGAGMRTFGSRYASSIAPQNLHLRGTALFGRGRTRFEAGLQTSFGEITYPNSDGSDYITRNDFFIGFPIGFRYQYPHSGFFARAYTLPAFAVATPVAPYINTGVGLGYTF